MMSPLPTATLVSGWFAPTVLFIAQKQVADEHENQQRNAGVSQVVLGVPPTSGFADESRG